MTLWLEVTQDKYRLPIVVAGSIRELGKRCRITPGAISLAIKRAENKDTKSKFIKIEVDDNE